MKKILLLCLATMLVACGPDWKRVKNANSVSIVGVGYADDLKPFDKNGNFGKDGSKNVGIGEGLGVIGGIVKGKGLKGVKDAGDQRKKNDAITFKNIEAFQKSTVKLVKSALAKNKYKVVEYEALDDINLKDKELSKSLVEEAGTDLIINSNYTFGYILKDKNFGLTKEYRLALKVRLDFSDKKGYIGSRSYFVKSSKRASSDGPIPAFNEDAFVSLEKAYLRNLRTDIKKIKLKK